MKTITTSILFVGSIICCPDTAVCQKQTDQWELAIRQSISEFVEAFNRGDAAAVASHWTADGEYITPDGETWVGRKAIHDLYAQVFTDIKGLRLEIDNLTIYQVEPQVVVEEGMAKVTRQDHDPEWTRYTARHVRENGQWKIVSLSETYADIEAPSQHEHLKELEWLVGEWVDESEHAAIDSTCRWSKNQNFLTQYMTVALEGKVELEVMQIIGYDAPSGEIRSWIFDSDGGTGSGVWSRDGNTWSVAASYSMPDGSKGQARNIYTLTADGLFTWQSVDRSINGEPIGDVPVIKITRKP